MAGLSAPWMLNEGGEMLTPNQTPKLTRAFLTSTENVALGIGGGCAETCLLMPLLTWKFTIQEGRSLPARLGGWYRGVATQAGSVAPITGVQLMANGLLERLIVGGERDLTDGERIISSIGAGALSSLLYSPVDLVTIHQQKLKQNPINTMKHLHSTHGVRILFRGVSACACREAIYTCGYLGMTPVIADYLRRSEFTTNDVSANLTAAVCSGIVASTLSHPIDTGKTVMQADIASTQYKTARAAMLGFWRERGFASLYTGGVPRLIRNCGAFFIVGMMREKYIAYKTDKDNR